MREFQVSGAAVLWGIAYTLLMAAGAIFVFAPDGGRWAYLCGTAACVTTGAAAVMQIHGFCVRLCRLIRAATGYGGLDDDEGRLRVVP